MARQREIHAMQALDRLAQEIDERADESAHHGAGGDLGQGVRAQATPEIGGGVFQAPDNLACARCNTGRGELLVHHLVFKTLGRA